MRKINMRRTIIVLCLALGGLAAASASPPPRPDTAAVQTAAPLKPTGGRGLTEVQGIKVGSHTLSERPTGCTVIMVDGEGVPGGVSQRGGAPGTSETDLLHPLNMVDQVNAVVLAGGTAYGLDVRQGVLKFLEERNIGWRVSTGV